MYYYLASPYSHPDPAKRSERYGAAVAASAWLFKRSIFNFSPIVSCHPLSVSHSLPGDAEFWKKFDQTMIRMSGGVIVLQIEGWRESVGVQAEIAFANFLGVRVTGLQVLVDGEYKLT